jgi:hypothetical protein
MAVLTDIWGNDVEVTSSYVSHRNRLIDIHLIHTFQTKGKRLLINTFKQNETVPSMCIFFESKEKAEHAYQVMKGVYYGPPLPVSKEIGLCETMSYMLMSLAVPIGFAAALISRSC